MTEKRNINQNIPGMPKVGPKNRFAEVQHAENAGATLKRISKYFAAERVIVFLMMLVVVFGTVCGILAPSLQSNAIDILTDILGGLPGDALPRTLFAMSVVYILYGLMQFFQTLLGAHLSQRIVKLMRGELFEKIVDLPIKYLDTHSHGDVMSRMTNDIENISTTVSQSITSLFSGVLTIAGTVVIMVWYCWQLALLSCITVILTVLATKLLSGKVRKYSRLRQALLGAVNGTVEEMVSGYRTVVAFNHQDATIESFRKTSDSLTREGIKTDILSGVMGPIMNCIGNIGFVIIAAVGGYFSYKGLISVGVISAFIVYAKQFSRPINEIAQIYGQLQTAVAGAERVFVVLDEESERADGEDVSENADTYVTFDDVTFSYTEGHPVIKNFSLKVPSGKKVALVGATGSGKTTVVNLLMRFYDVDSGTIRIGNQDIAALSASELRKCVAIVLQDTVLFSDTIRHNLKYGNENADDELLEKAIEMSRCGEMLRSMPKGLDTVLTASGANISQGQRQLLAIARAFIADTRILILDEATSNVDTRTEKYIQDAMQLVMKDRTSIIIAHRLSTIRDSDIIVVMDKGRIVEQGSHDELLLKKGKYYDLYMTQYAGFAT